MKFAQHAGSRLSIRSIEADVFRDFARRFGTSDEVGPIATTLDKSAGDSANVENNLLGLFGCETLCAVACFLVMSGDDGSQVCKLDSVIVDSALRRRGLAKMLIASTFSDLVTRFDGRLDRVYAHSVHPATVRLLVSLGFEPPPPVGAPLSVIDLGGSGQRQLAERCEGVRDGIADRLKLQCAFCQAGDRRARPWCKPAARPPERYPAG